MKVSGGPDAWRARLDGLTKSDGVRGPDPARAKAAEDLYRAAEVRGRGSRATESFLGAGRRLWDARGGDGIPQLAARVAEEGVQGHREQLLTASKDELTEVVDELALLCLQAEDGAAPLDRLLDLKAILAAGQDVAKAYKKRRKTTPAAQRLGEDLDPRWDEVLDTLEARLTQVARAERITTFAEGLGRASTRIGRWARAAHVDAAAHAAGAVAAGLYGAGAKVAGAVRGAFGGGEGEAKAPAWISAAITKVKGLLDKVLPQPVLEGVEGLTQGARGLVTALYKVDDDAHDVDALVDRLVDALDTAKPLVDPSADAVAVGVLKEATVILNGARGQELVYNRGTGQLQLNALDLVGARVGIGATMRAFCRNLYGDPDQIDRSKGRAGLEVGALVGHAGFFSTQVPDVPQDEAPRGWMSTVSMGYTLSLPMISDQSLFAVRERATAKFELSDAQRARIEAVFEQIPEEAATYTDALGEAVKGAS